MHGPGSYELVPIRRVPVDPDDLDALGSAVAELGQALLPAGDETIAETLAEWAKNVGFHQLAPGDLVARAAQVHAVLAMPAGDDTALLVARIPVVGEWQLEVEEVRAYDYFVRRVLAVWNTDTQGRRDPLQAWLHFGAR